MTRRLRSAALVAGIATVLTVATVTPASASIKSVSTSNGRCILLVQRTPAPASVFRDECTPVKARVTYRTAGGASLSTAYGPTDAWESLAYPGTTMVVDRGAAGAYNGSALSAWSSF